MARISEIISELTPKPTFIGLQEVTPVLLQGLSPLLQSMGYRIICQEGVSYGCAIAILTARSLNGRESAPSADVILSGFQPYRQTRMERGLLWVHAKVDTVGEVLFSTTHLESYMKNNDGSRERETQIKEASTFCLEKGARSNLKSVFITGDLNWDDENKRVAGTDPKLLATINNESVGEETQWLDAWLQTRPGQDGYTFDSKENPMLKGNLRRRFDRCLAYSSEIAIYSTDLCGTEAIPGLTWRKKVEKWGTGAVSYDMRPLAPSDHFGLVATFGDVSNAPRVVAPVKLATKRKKKT